MTARKHGKKAVFVLCVRNAERTLDAVLANVARFSTLFAASSVLFLENDSRDATRDIIARWRAGRPNAHLIHVEGLSANPVRTLCLEAVRNRALAAVREGFADHDYMFLLDCDEVNSGDISQDAVRRAIAFLDEEDSRAAMFANSAGIYFDLWALRHPSRCPGDVWEEVCDHVIAHGGRDEDAYQATLAKRVFALPPDAPPLEVDSAFGGFGIYKIASVLANPCRYVGAKTKFIPPHVAGITRANGAELGWQVCEHVAFHAGFRARGERLFILPFLINCRVPEANFPPSAWRSFLFDPRAVAAAQTVAAVPRNQPCPCGSGQRYKHCHGRMA